MAIEATAHRLPTADRLDLAVRWMVDRWRRSAVHPPSTPIAVFPFFGTISPPIAATSTSIPRSGRSRLGGSTPPLIECRDAPTFDEGGAGPASRRVGVSEPPVRGAPPRPSRPGSSWRTRRGSARPHPCGDGLRAGGSATLAQRDGSGSAVGATQGEGPGRLLAGPCPELAQHPRPEPGHRNHGQRRYHA